MAFPLFQPRYVVNAANLPERFDDCVAGKLVQLERHNRVAALFLAENAHRGDVYIRLGQAAGDARNRARRVVMADDERILLAGEVHLQAVELLNHHAPAADAGRAHGDRFAAGSGDMQDDGVRVRCAQRNGSEAHLHPRRGRHGKRVAQARVVHVHAHQAADKRAVGAVPLIRFFKRAVQADFGPCRRFAQQIARDAANARRSRRMRR